MKPSTYDIYKYISYFTVKVIQLINGGSKHHRRPNELQLLSVCGDGILLQIRLRGYIIPQYFYFNSHIGWKLAKNHMDSSVHCSQNILVQTFIRSFFLYMLFSCSIV